MTNAHKRSHERFRELASSVAGDIGRGQYTEMPSIRQLASSYGAAYPTMCKAVQLLVTQGLLTCVAGRKIRLPGESTVSPAQKFFDIIHARIADGTYRTGRPLPKYAYFQREYHVSTAAITSALEQAHDAGLVHKKGKQWITGAEPTQTPVTDKVRRRRPTVLVLVSSNHSWISLNYSPYTQPFVGAALSEFRDFDIHAQMCIELAEERVAAVPTGLDEILSYARSLGDDYAGTLIGHMQSPSETVKAWIGRLCRLNRPVVFFDNDDSRDAITRQSVGGTRHFYRCFIDQRQSVELSVRALHQLGHRRIGSIHTKGDIGWMKRRVALIEETAHRIDPAIVVTRACLEDEFGVYDDIRDMSSQAMDHYDVDSFVNRFRTSSGAVPIPRTQGSPQDVGGKLLWQRAASLRNLLGATTAWISPNDYYQQKVYLWTMCVGVRVPEDVSLVSFDNAATSFVFPLASIDPGFQHLGYLAAHILIGDISVAADRGGGVAGRCRLVDRGSLARPGDLGDDGRI